MDLTKLLNKPLFWSFYYGKNLTEKAQFPYEKDQNKGSFKGLAKSTSFGLLYSKGVENQKGRTYQIKPNIQIQTIKSINKSLLQEILGKPKPHYPL